jgi:hypothetical protein
MLQVDPYDDNRERLNQLPVELRDELLKTGADLTSTLNSLPDVDFALVVVAPGEDNRIHKFRKFACVDEGNTAQSVWYFLQTRNHLPDEMRKVAAQNLLRSARDFELTPPPDLVLLAEEEDPLPVTNVVISSMDKIASFLPPPETVEKIASEPVPVINCKEDVFDALAYYHDNAFALDGWEKQALARLLVPAAERFEVSVPTEIEKRAADTYAADLVEAVVCRQVMLAPEDDSEESFQKVAHVNGQYQSLLWSRADMGPTEFAHELDRIDSLAQLDGFVPDAVYSTFGKVAQTQPDPIFDNGVNKLYEDELVWFCQSYPKMVENQFGEELATAILKKPVVIFQSLPKPVQVALARLIAQKKSEYGVQL